MIVTELGHGFFVCSSDLTHQQQRACTAQNRRIKQSERGVTRTSQGRTIITPDARISAIENIITDEVIRFSIADGILTKNRATKCNDKKNIIKNAVKVNAEKI